MGCRSRNNNILLEIVVYNYISYRQDIRRRSLSSRVPCDAVARETFLPTAPSSQAAYTQRSQLPPAPPIRRLAIRDHRGPEASLFDLRPAVNCRHRCLYDSLSSLLTPSPRPTPSRSAVDRRRVRACPFGPRAVHALIQAP